MDVQRRQMARILVADDEPLIAMIVEDWLTELQHETAGPVGTVREALALIDSTELDGAILDVRLTDGTSYRVAEQLRARAIPFVFATGRDGDALDEQFRGFPTLTKPFDFDGLRRVLAQIVPSSAS